MSRFDKQALRRPVLRQDNFEQKARVEISLLKIESRKDGKFTAKIVTATRKMNGEKKEQSERIKTGPNNA